MTTLNGIIIEEFVMSQIGRWYTEILFDAEVNRDVETRLHGEWLRDEIVKKLEQHARSYN
jgi:hypothetical protein